MWKINSNDDVRLSVMVYRYIVRICKILLPSITINSPPHHLIYLIPHLISTIFQGHLPMISRQEFAMALVKARGEAKAQDVLALQLLGADIREVLRHTDVQHVQM